MRGPARLQSPSTYAHAALFVAATLVLGPPGAHVSKRGATALRVNKNWNTIWAYYVSCMHPAASGRTLAMLHAMQARYAARKLPCADAVAAECSARRRQACALPCPCQHLH